MNTGTSKTTRKTDLEVLLGWDNLDLELLPQFGHRRAG